ncbi:unnamed protein product [Acidithrix sp. C25]|nr:unnamed protein product [Acidithrix sp. C25]
MLDGGVVIAYSATRIRESFRSFLAADLIHFLVIRDDKFPKDGEAD